MRKRTQAREIALQALYQHDRLRPGSEALDSFINESTPDPAVREYARILIAGTVAMIEDLDRRIASAARNWKLQRIAPVDRSILRIALYEILESEDIPPKVAIDEAINLAKKYSTEQSGAFVNGILDRIYKDLEGAETSSPAADGGTGVPRGTQ